jgi:RNA polymerase sigma-70 factor (ECF subfamily)
MAERLQLVAFLTMLTGDRFAADDLFQETCLEAFRLRDKFRSGGNFGAWCRGLARIQALRYMRGRGKAAEVAFSPEVVGALDGTWSQVVEAPNFDERPRMLRACLGELHENQRRVLHLRYAEKYSYAEIADRMDRSIASLKMLSSRLRRKLRLCVELKLIDLENELAERANER